MPVLEEFLLEYRQMRCDPRISGTTALCAFAPAGVKRLIWISPRPTSPGEAYCIQRRSQLCGRFPFDVQARTARRTAS